MFKRSRVFLEGRVQVGLGQMPDVARLSEERDIRELKRAHHELLCVKRFQVMVLSPGSVCARQQHEQDCQKRT